MTTIIERLGAAYRAFVLGPSVVEAYDTYFGHDVSEFSPEEYGNYIATSNAVYSCATQRAQFLSSLPLALYRLTRAGDKERIDRGDLFSLLQKVNPFWTFGRLIEMTELTLCLWGQSFWFLERGESGRLPPREIWWARPDRVRVIPHETDYIGGYLYYPAQGSTPVRYEPEEVIWFRYPNPLDEYAPLSPLAAARISADYASAAMKSNKNLFENGLQMGGAIFPKSGQVLTAEQAAAIETALDRRFKGVDKAHRWGVFRFEADMKQVGWSPHEAEFLGGLQWSLEDVCRAYKWPIDLVGGKRTYENVNAAMRAAWTNAVLPEGRFVATELTEQLLPMFPGQADLVEFDSSNIDVLQEAESERWERARGQIEVGATLINEWRDKQGMGPVPWGDTWWKPWTNVSVEEDRQPGQNGQPPANTQPADTQPLNNGESRGVRIPLEYGSAEHERLWQRFVRRTEAQEREFSRVVTALFERQRDSVMARLRNEGPAATADNPFDRPRWIREFRQDARPVLERIIRGSADNALDDLGLRSHKRQFLDALLRFLERRAQRFAEEVCATTWNRLKESLAQGIEEGDNIPEFMERVVSVMQDRIRSTPETIARTEVIGAANGGTLIAWRESGVVAGKRWLAALDNRTRMTHIDAHGQTIDIDGDFAVGAGAGPAPGQIGVAAEDINCRCTMTAVLDV